MLHIKLKFLPIITAIFFGVSSEAFGPTTTTIISSILNRNRHYENINKNNNVNFLSSRLNLSSSTGYYNNNNDDNDNDDEEDEDEALLAAQSELEQLLQNNASSSKSSGSGGGGGSDGPKTRPATESEIEAAERLAGNVNIPKTGTSISDQMTEIQSKEKFVSQVFPLKVDNDDSGKGNDDGDKGDAKVAAIQTVTAGSIGDEPMRYIIALDNDENDDDDDNKPRSRKYTMVDVPPYSDHLVEQIKTFMSNPSSSNDNDDSVKENQTSQEGVLSTILITCKDNIHYDDTPAIYVTRKSDLLKWKKAFPDIQIVIYRLDTPRDCKDVITQTLDGYGPWGLQLDDKNDENEEDSFTSNSQFVETGRPLTRMEWDEDTQKSVLDEGNIPPDDEGDGDDKEVEALYTPEAIKKREENKNIIALYTPGHTYGSITYIFPKLRVCCSGYTIPVEDNRTSDNNVAGMAAAGPALDYRGYITTNSGGIDRQIESAREVVNVYGDRFDIVLPSRGPPVTLGHLKLDQRKRILLDMLNEYAELGRVYESMGII